MKTYKQNKNFLLRETQGAASSNLRGQVVNSSSCLSQEPMPYGHWNVQSREC